MTGQWLWLIHKFSNLSPRSAESAGANRVSAEQGEGGRRGLGLLLGVLLVAGVLWPRSLRAQLPSSEREAVIAFMEWSVLAAHSLPALEGVRPPPLALQPPACKEKAEPVGDDRQANLGVDAGGGRTGHLCCLD